MFIHSNIPHYENVNFIDCLNVFIYNLLSEVEPKNIDTPLKSE